MARGKNYIIMIITLENSIRTIPKTILAWIFPGKQWKIEPIEWIGFQKTNIITPLNATT